MNGHSLLAAKRLTLKEHFASYNGIMFAFLWKSLPLAVFLAVWMVLGAEPALAWGAPTHVLLAREVLGLSTLLPATMAGLLTRFAQDFLYGNIAADVIFAKKFCAAKWHCHNWSTGFKLLEESRDDRSRAFSWGYLCHLAADTIAHNKFVPGQIVTHRTTIGFGHLYWEMRADAALPHSVWPRVQIVLRRHYPHHDELMAEHLTTTLLPFRQSLRFFKRTNLLNAARAWQRGMRIWERLSRFPLDRKMLDDYHDECLARILDLLTHQHKAKVLREDPIGSAAFSQIKPQRKHLRRITRAGISANDLWHETLRQYATDAHVLGALHHRLKQTHLAYPVLKLEKA